MVYKNLYGCDFDICFQEIFIHSEFEILRTQREHKREAVIAKGIHVEIPTQYQYLCITCPAISSCWCHKTSDSAHLSSLSISRYSI